MKPFGISAALLTPFTTGDEIDLPALTSHANGLLARGVQGVTLFGTTGEGASVSRAERGDALRAVLDAGVAPDCITLGTAAPALGDTVEQINAGVSMGVGAFLSCPPFTSRGAMMRGCLHGICSLPARRRTAQS